MKCKEFELLKKKKFGESAVLPWDFKSYSEPLLRKYEMPEREAVIWKEQMHKDFCLLRVEEFLSAVNGNDGK